MIISTPNLNLSTDTPNPFNITKIKLIPVKGEPGEPGIGGSDAVKVALLNCFAHVAWVDDQGQTYYDALYNALYPPASLSSISAVYTQGGIVYTSDSLDSLKTDLIVTANWSDSTTTTIDAADYTLSGSLTEGTSTITVTYSGKTTTFDVTVTQATVIYTITNTLSNVTNSNAAASINENEAYTATLTASDGYEMSSVSITMGGLNITSSVYSDGAINIPAVTGDIIITATAVVSARTLIHSWDFTSGLTDSVGGSTATLSNATQDSDGLHLTKSSSVCFLGTDVYPVGSVVEVDFVSTSASLSSSHGRLLMIQDISSPTISANAGNGFIYRSTGAWAFYRTTWSSASAITNSDYFSGKTLSMRYYLDSGSYYTAVSVGDTNVITYKTGRWNSTGANPLQLGSTSNAFRGAVISAIRIYQENE